MDLIKEAAKYNIEITPQMNSEFEEYSKMMLHYNEFMNLTAITEIDEIKEKHFSLYAVKLQ